MVYSLDLSLMTEKYPCGFEDTLVWSLIVVNSLDLSLVTEQHL